MERAAFYLSGLVGYVSPGTVECMRLLSFCFCAALTFSTDLYSHPEDYFYFLDPNP